MITAPVGQWLLTAVFAAAALAAALSRRVARDAARTADAAFCGAMCVALIVMTWGAEPAAATWAQVAAFGCAALWFATRPGLSAVLHVLMAGAMIWMLAVLPAVSDMSRHHDGMSMAPAAAPTPVLAGSVVLATCCLAACLPWLTRAVGPGLRLADPSSAGQAAMSAGMAAMLLAAL
jgi:hypothetical protein